MGDPVGIGPEIIAKAIDSGELLPLCRTIVIGDAGVMRKLIEEQRLSISVRGITSITDACPAPGKLDVLDLQNVNLATHAWGRPDASSGTAVVEYIRRAVDLALKSDIDALVTAPKIGRAHV